MILIWGNIFIDVYREEFTNRKRQPAIGQQDGHHNKQQRVGAGDMNQMKYTDNYKICYL